MGDSSHLEQEHKFPTSSQKQQVLVAFYSLYQKGHRGEYLRLGGIRLALEKKCLFVEPSYKSRITKMDDDRRLIKKIIDEECLKDNRIFVDLEVLDVGE